MIRVGREDRLFAVFRLDSSQFHQPSYPFAIERVEAFLFA